MTKREYEKVILAMRYFMEDEPTDETPKDIADSFRGWSGGMEILDDLCIAYRKKMKRSHNVLHKARPRTLFRSTAEIPVALM